MGHFNACDNRLITIMSKDRKDRKARTARARVSGPGFGPEKLEPDPDRGNSRPDPCPSPTFGPRIDFSQLIIWSGKCKLDM